MSASEEYRFKIDAYTPDTISMERLAQYMSYFASLMGEPHGVHFVKLEKGSCTLISRIDDESVPKVKKRLESTKRGEGPPDAMMALRNINHRLKLDNTSGDLTEREGAEIIRFPGYEMVEAVTFGAFNQDGSLDGMVIRLGGMQDPVPVHIQNGPFVYHCTATREMARRLGQHIYGKQIRAIGTGRWCRDDEGKWELLKFKIRDFDVLNDAPLTSVVEKMKDIQGSDWDQFEDPWGELEKIRRGPNGTT